MGLEVVPISAKDKETLNPSTKPVPGERQPTRIGIDRIGQPGYKYWGMGTERNEDKKWMDQGVDIWLIRDNLELSYEERARQHQYMLNLIEELNQIGNRNRERPSGSSQIINS